MKLKVSIIILASLLHTVMAISCRSEENKDNPSSKIEDTIISTPSDGDAVSDIIIGGRNYNKWRSSIFNSINSNLAIRLDPNNPDASKSFDGIEELQVLKDILIGGNNFDMVDFSPIGKLENLRRLQIGTMHTETGFTRIPDLSGLDSLLYLTIENANLSSLDGIEKLINLEYLDIFDTDNMYMQATDMSALGKLAGLIRLRIVGGGEIHFADWDGPASLTDIEISKRKLGRVTIDCTGIEVLSGLKNISMEDCNTVIHIEELAKLKNIETLCLDISNSAQTLDFLSAMTSLRTLHLYGDYNDTAIYLFGENKHNYVQIDLSPLKALVNLKMLTVQGFTIENFHILDELPELRHVDVYNSRFYPEDNNNLTRDDIGIIRELQSDR